MKKMLTNDDSFVPHVGQLLDETTLLTRSCTRGGMGQHLGAASIVHALTKCMTESVIACRWLLLLDGDVT